MLFFFILLSGAISQTFGQKIVQPYGPLMCEGLCKIAISCSKVIFDEVHLKCLLSEAPTVNCFSPVETSCDRKTKESDEMVTSKKEPVCSENNVKLFHKACKEGKVKKARKLLSQGVVDVDCRNRMGITAVYHAAEHGRRHIFDLLMQYNCDVAVVSPHICNNVLHYACKGGNKHIVKALLDTHKFDIDSQGRVGRTPLMYAVIGGHLEIVKLLKSRGAGMQITNNYGNNVLQLACLCENVEMVKYLLSLNVFDLDRKGQNGRSAFLHAVKRRNLSIVKLLYQHHASVTTRNCLGQTVFHVACEYGRSKIVDYLVSLKELKGFEKKKDFQGRIPKCKSFRD